MFLAGLESPSRQSTKVDIGVESDTKVDTDTGLCLAAGTKIILQRPGDEHFSTFIVRTQTQIDAIEIGPSTQRVDSRVVQPWNRVKKLKSSKQEETEYFVKKYL